MRMLLDQCWRMLAEKDHNIDAFQLLTQLERISPDPDAYDVYGVYPAFDMCWLAEQALLSRTNPDKHRAPEASARAMATVMDFIQMSEGEGLDDDQLVHLFDHHELIRVERAFQKTLLTDLRRTRTPDEEFVSYLRDMAANDGISNLGIALDDD